VVACFDGDGARVEPTRAGEPESCVEDRRIADGFEFVAAIEASGARVELLR
jgi:hypothetical protein